ncbi:MAG: hypothetical protein RL497_838 [Pseudomonadota bacterium]|jgi:hypothetical protein
MRKKNLKLAVTLHPSRNYLHGIIALHTLASITSLCLPLAMGYHLIGLSGIAISLCYQLTRYWHYSAVRQISFDGTTVAVRSLTIHSAEIQSLAAQSFDTQRPPHEEHEEIGVLTPSVWVLPGVNVFYFQNQEGSKKNLPIFADAVSKDDFRKLRIFALRGPLF